MKSKSVSLLLCGAIAAGAGASTLPRPKAQPLTRQAYSAQKAQIDTQFQATRKLCEKMKGNTRDVCRTEAKARADALQAQLEARYQPSPDATLKAKTVTAEANYSVARAKCDAIQGDARDRCVKEAKDAREAALRQAKVEKVQETGGPFASGSAAAHRHLHAGAS